MSDLSYHEFLERKSQSDTRSGFEPLWIPDFLLPFQKALVEWALRKGKAAIFADCGLGKTPMQLVWAENIIRETNGRVLILTPLAVAQQTVREAGKFGIDAARSPDGRLPSSRIVVSNYERLHYFNSSDFAGVVCDESSILKHFSGERQMAVTEFMRQIRYRLLCTATAAPNDYMELGTSSEALGELPHMDMLGMFFKNTQNDGIDRHNATRFGPIVQWRFKKHAELHFWRWVCSWSRAMRRPSDFGFEDNGFILPPLEVSEQAVIEVAPPPGCLFHMTAQGLEEQREEVRRTLPQRCALAAKLVSANKGQSIVWCQLNDEGKMLGKLISDAEEVAGATPDERKEELFEAFVSGQLRVLITKAKIASFGLNLQCCNHMTFFPSHSYEQYYQAVRRCWRFGQKRSVHVDIITTEGERAVMANLQRKSDQADKMFSTLVAEMNNAMQVNMEEHNPERVEVPSWL